MNYSWWIIYLKFFAMSALLTTWVGFFKTVAILLIAALVICIFYVVYTVYNGRSAEILHNFVLRPTVRRRMNQLGYKMFIYNPRSVHTIKLWSDISWVLKKKDDAAVYTIPSYKMLPMVLTRNFPAIREYSKQYGKVVRIADDHVKLAKDWMVDRHA